MTSKLSLMPCHIYNNKWLKNCWWTECHFKQKPVCSHFLHEVKLKSTYQRLGVWNKFKGFVCLACQWVQFCWTGTKPISTNNATMLFLEVYFAIILKWHTMFSSEVWVLNTKGLIYRIHHNSSYSVWHDRHTQRSVPQTRQQQHEKLQNIQTA